MEVVVDKQNSDGRGEQNKPGLVETEWSFVRKEELSRPTPEEKMRWADDGGPDYE
jgi:hypothetical protein